MPLRSNTSLRLIATLFFSLLSINLACAANEVDQLLAVFSGDQENLEKACSVETLSKVAESKRLNEVANAFYQFSGNKRFRGVEAALMKTSQKMWDLGMRSQVVKLDAALVAGSDSLASFRTGWPRMAAHRLAATGNKKALLRLAETYYLYPHRNRKLTGNIEQYLSYTLRTIYIPRIRSDDRSARYEIIYLLKNHHLLEQFEKSAAIRWNKERADYKTLSVWIYVRILLGTDDTSLWEKFEQSNSQRLIKHEASQGSTRYHGFSSFARLMLLHGIYSDAFAVSSSAYFRRIKPTVDTGLDQCKHYIDIGLLLANLEADHGNHQASGKILREVLDSFAKLKYRRSVMERMPFVIRALRNADQAELLRQYLSHYEKFFGEGSTDKGYDKIPSYQDTFDWLAIAETFHLPMALKLEIFKTADASVEVLLTPKTGDPSLDTGAWKRHISYLLANGMLDQAEALVQRIERIYKHVPNDSVRAAVKQMKQWLLKSTQASKPIAWWTADEGVLGVSLFHMATNHNEGSQTVFPTSSYEGGWSIYAEQNGWLKPAGRVTHTPEGYLNFQPLADVKKARYLKLMLTDRQQGMMLGNAFPTATSDNLIERWYEMTRDEWPGCGVTSIRKADHALRIQRGGLPTGGYSFDFDSNRFPISPSKKYHLSVGMYAYGKHARGALAISWHDENGTKLGESALMDTQGETPLRQQFSVFVNSGGARSRHNMPVGATHAKLRMRAGIGIELKIKDLMFVECGHAESITSQQTMTSDESMGKWIETNDIIQAVAVAENGRSIVVALNKQHTLVKYDLITKKELQRYPLNKGEFATWVSSAGRDTWVALIKGTNRKAGEFLILKGNKPPRRVPTGLKKDYTLATLARDGSQLAWTQRDGNGMTVMVSSTAGDWTPKSYTFPKVTSIAAMKFSDDNKHLIIREGTKRHYLRLDTMLPEKTDADLLVFSWHKTELSEFRSIPEVRSCNGSLPFRQMALSAGLDRLITWKTVSGVSEITIREMQTAKAIDSLKLSYIRHLIIMPASHDLLITQGKGVIYRLPKEVWLKERGQER